MRRRVALAMIFALQVLAPAASARDMAPVPAGACEIVDRSSAVVLLACPANLLPEALRQAGVAACGMYIQCNAWIWTDKTKMPTKAPVTQAELPESFRANAIAIWDNESQSLLTLRRKPR